MIAKLETQRINRKGTKYSITKQGTNAENPLMGATMSPQQHNHCFRTDNSLFFKPLVEWVDLNAF